MKSIFLAIIFMFFKLSISALSLDELKIKYKNIQSLEAVILQKKTASYLFSPIVNDIKLRIKNNTVFWQTLSPEKSEIQLTNNELFIIEKNGNRKKILINEDSEVKNFIDIISSIFSLNFEKIQDNFDLKFNARNMTASLRKNSSKQIITSILFIFNDNNDIAKIIINSKDETTELNFKKLEIQYK